jgi:uncharacterized protein (TIGR02246 family)
MSKKRADSVNEAEVRNLVERWADAVRRRDIEAILRDHASDIWMFDVPPPFERTGVESYAGSWDLFFSASPTPAVFDIVEMKITAGNDVAFVVALMRCVMIAKGKAPEDLDFRLTIGLRKIGDRWTIVHEHHSVPADD